MVHDDSSFASIVCGLLKVEIEPAQVLRTLDCEDMENNQ